MIVLVLLAVVVGLASTKYREVLTLENLARHETELKDYQAEHPAVVYGGAFLAYVLVAGLSLPGATVMTLLMGWYFKFWHGLVLVSFASTAGATLAFLLCRYLFREAMQKKFGDRLQTVNGAFDREGAFYLFAMRLIPAMPFFLVNVLMGMTRISIWTFWWVSQIGMFAGTMVYTYAGSRVPDLQTLAAEGAQALFSPAQLFQITVAFMLLGIFPLVVKRLMGRFGPGGS